jgi:hypothetical protein
MTSSQTRRLAHEVEARAVELWHTAADEPFITVSLNDPVSRREHYALNSRAFRGWVLQACTLQASTSHLWNLLTPAVKLLAQKAQQGPEYEAPCRLAGTECEVWLDLGRLDRAAVQVTPQGWEVQAIPEPRFRRVPGMLELPMPVRGGSLEGLRSFVNLEDEDWPLLVGWMVGTLKPGGPYPVLVLNGPPGSGKSMACRVLRALVDPHTMDLLYPPEQARDLLNWPGHGHFLVLDHVSSVSRGLSDVLCLLAAGKKRERRPCVLTGMAPYMNRPHLLDHALELLLPLIEASHRQTEEDLWRRFEATAPRLLGALLDAVATALANVGHTGLDSHLRLVEFVRWVVAAEPGLPWPPGTFLERYGQKAWWA